VEVAARDDGRTIVLVRDSKNPSDGILAFDAGAWMAFIEDIKSGHLHRD
jgi:hypothetical protein